MTVSPDLISEIESVLSSDIDDFEQLARSAGLDPEKDFQGIFLKGIDLSGCDLRAFDFSGSDLRDASFGGATIYKKSLINAVLKGANFEGVKLISEYETEISGLDIALSSFPNEILQAIASSLGKAVDQLAIGDLLVVPWLDLSGTQVTDLAPLQNLNSLQTLYLRDTQVSVSEKEDLKKALSELEIFD